MNLSKLRHEASLLSKGSSSNEILESVLTEVKGLFIPSNLKILDVGCGQGELLKKISKILPNAEMNGCDYVDYKSFDLNDLKFFQHDCNLNLPVEDASFDLITSSEVIEHLENPRHFVRELARITKPQGFIVITTPNLESYTSLISFWIRGYHSAFGGKAYPAHITAVGSFDLQNIVKETGSLTIEKLHFISNGRIPGTKFYWNKIFPWMKGKRVSDNYLMVLKKNK